MLSYYQILAISYISVLVIWWMLLYRFPGNLMGTKNHLIKRPWAQSGLIILAALFTILIGKLYTAGYLLPKFEIGQIHVSEGINQLLIYAPFPLFVFFSRQSFSSVWLTPKNWYVRLSIGFALSLLAISIFTVLEGQSITISLLGDLFHLKNLDFGVQIFMEDFAIALLLSRLVAALGKKYFIVALSIVAVLFALSHIPYNLQQGEPLQTIILDRTFDASLTFIIAYLLYYSKDFLWFFPIHYAMDMMQFHFN
ncbi:MAG: hypothetical protein KDC79_08590 [Cyclobacteriaceae bacterium]|nr:hypothetical protein [Cyclobacteriaceae bacterium]